MNAVKYKGYLIEETSTTIGKELCGGKKDKWLLKITDKNGHAIRNKKGNLPIITSLAGAKAAINAEINGQ